MFNKQNSIFLPGMIFLFCFCTYVTTNGKFGLDTQIAHIFISVYDVIFFLIDGEFIEEATARMVSHMGKLVDTMLPVENCSSKIKWDFDVLKFLFLDARRKRKISSHKIFLLKFFF